MSSSAKTQCAHDSCGCTPESGEGVTKDGEWYCSAGCVEGEGCGHPGCGCGSQAGSGSPQDASNPTQRGNPTKPAPSRNPGHDVDFNPGQGGPSTRRQP